MADKTTKNQTKNGVGDDLRVMVYGTLKGGHPNHGAITGAEFLGRHCLEGYQMVDLGWYPGVIKGGENTKIFGEVYKITKEMLSIMDSIEGHPNYYERKEVDIEEHGGKTWIYLLPSEYLEENDPVEGGCWRPSQEEVVYAKQQCGTDLAVFADHNE